ncbi:hypothetical protein Gorai_021625, partial [Gossypium raimondii]|nr:hypothetical protein [Gossypium raimondii]
MTIINSDINNSNNGESDDKRERNEVLQRSGEAWICEILSGHESRCMINFIMSSIVFKSLLRVLEAQYNLQGSINMSSQEM